MEEFHQAYHEVVAGRLNYIIVVLLQRPIRNDLPPELETYLSSHTYIDAQKYPRNVDLIRKRIRFAMPKTPLNQLNVSIDTFLVSHFLYLTKDLLQQNYM